MAGHGEEEFDEGEVWDVLQDRSKEAAVSDFTPPMRSRRVAGSKNKGAAVAKDDEEEATGACRRRGRRPSSSSSSTAPVAIPDSCSSGRIGAGGRRRDQEEEEDDAEAGDVLPPHEWLARKMEKMSTVPEASSPEMVRGRSKGREMRKFRDSVLPKTAFSEQ